MAAEVMYIPARNDDFPSFLGRENDKGTPITALVVSSIAVQALLSLTLVVTDALNFMLDLSSSLSLLPYFLAAAYALKLGLTGESYEQVSSGVRRKETIFAGAATAYTLFYVKARSEHGRRIFTPTEIALFVAILLGGILAVAGLWTGHITL